jgi:hypothetical protein
MGRERARASRSGCSSKLARTENPVQASPAGFSGLLHPRGCAEPGGVRSRRLRADVESMSMVSNSDDLALPGSAHGYLGVRFVFEARQRAGPACSARTKSAPPRHQGEDHRDRVLSDARRSSGPATVRERETRNPNRPHDASRSPSVEWDEARIGMGRKGGDKFGRGTGGLPSPLGEEGGSAKQRRMRAEPQPKTRKGRLRDPSFIHRLRRHPLPQGEKGRNARYSAGCGCAPCASSCAPWREPWTLRAR